MIALTISPKLYEQKIINHVLVEHFKCERFKDRGVCFYIHLVLNLEHVNSGNLGKKYNSLKYGFPHEGPVEEGDLRRILGHLQIGFIDFATCYINNHSVL